jgi:hypothetical protein
MDRDLLLSKYRSMAVLTTVLGVVWLILAAAMAVLVELIFHLATISEAPLPFAHEMQVIMLFGAWSGAITGPLAAGFVLAGWRAIKGPFDRGRRGLVWAAWSAAVATALLAALWSYFTARADLGVGMHLFGVCTHLGQGALCVLAARFLSSPELLAAGAQR